MTPKWTTSCPDWEQRIVAGESIVPVQPLYPEAANIAEAFFCRLVLNDVTGRPTIGEVTRPWVFQYVAAIFGAMNPQTYRREINDFFLLIAKKNTKSTMAAAIMLTAMYVEAYFDVRGSSEYLILAPTKEVADNSFKPACDMIRADAELSVIYKISEHTRTITDIETGTTLKVVAADAATVGGKKATGVLIDELHLFGEMHDAEAMINEATGGLASRPDGFVIKLTTQSSKPPAGVFKNELTVARKVRNGEVTLPNYMPVLYEYPRHMVESGAYKRPENFYIANPNLGASVDEQTLLAKLKKAELLDGDGDEGESLTDLYAKHFNIEVGMALHANRWPGADFWQASAAKLRLDSIIDESDVLTIGADGGGLDDLLGMAAIGRSKKNGRWLIWGKAWADSIVLQRRQKIASRLQDFQRDGDLVFCDSANEDCSEFAALAKTVYDSGKLYGIAFDPKMVGGLVVAAENAGIGEDYRYGVFMAVEVQAGAIALEKMLRHRMALHSGQPLMDWCISNTKLSPSADGRTFKVNKYASGFAKIDPTIAMFNAAYLMSLNPEPKGQGISVHFI